MGKDKETMQRLVLKHIYKCQDNKYLDRGSFKMTKDNKPASDKFMVRSINDLSKQLILIRKVMGQTTDALKTFAKKIHSHDKMITTLKNEVENVSKKPVENSQDHIKKLVSMNKTLLKLIDEEEHLDKKVVPQIEKKIHDISREVRTNYSNIKDLQLSDQHLEIKQKSLEKSIVSAHSKRYNTPTGNDLLDVHKKMAELARLNNNMMKLIKLSGRKDLEDIKKTLDDHSKKIFQMSAFETDELVVLVSDLEKAMKTNRERVDRIEVSSNNIERDLSSIMRMNERFVSLLNRKEQMDYKSLKISAQEAKRLSDLAGNVNSRLDTMETKITSIESTGPAELRIPPELTERLTENIDNIKSQISKIKIPQVPQPSPQTLQQFKIITEKMNKLESRLESLAAVDRSAKPTLDKTSGSMEEILGIRDEMRSMMENTRKFVSLVSKREVISMKQEESLKSKETDLNNLVNSLSNLIEETEKKKEKLEMMIAQGQQVFSILKKKERRTESELDVQLDAILNKI